MGGAAVSCLVHARKRPSGPLTRRYAPATAVALPGPLRPRTKASETFLAGIALQGKGGEAEPVKTAAGCAGRRRHLPTVLHSTSAGASMPLTRHPEVSHAVDFNVCFVPEGDGEYIMIHQLTGDIARARLYMTPDKEVQKDASL